MIDRKTEKKKTFAALEATVHANRTQCTDESVTILREPLLVVTGLNVELGQNQH